MYKQVLDKCEYARGERSAEFDARIHRANPLALDTLQQYRKNTYSLFSTTYIAGYNKRAQELNQAPFGGGT